MHVPVRKRRLHWLLQPAVQFLELETRTNYLFIWSRYTSTRVEVLGELNVRRFKHGVAYIRVTLEACNRDPAQLSIRHGAVRFNFRIRMTRGRCVFV